MHFVFFLLDVRIKCSEEMRRCFHHKNKTKQKTILSTIPVVTFSYLKVSFPSWKIEARTHDEKTKCSVSFKLCCSMYKCSVLSELCLFH